VGRLNSENPKNKEKRSLVGLTPDFAVFVIKDKGVV
jgi:hypothetical protein